jgi:signal transduction histidine kinase
MTAATWQSDGVSYPGVFPLDGRAAARRARLTLAAAGLFGAGITTSLALFVLTTSTLATAPTGTGLLALLLVVPLLGGHAGAYRRAVGRLRGEPIEPSYAPAAGRPWAQRLGIWARDPARWRDYAHAGFAGTGGAAMMLVVVAAAAAPVTYLVLALVLRGVPRVVFALLVGPAAVVWWVLTPVLVRARLACDDAMLRPRRVATLRARVAAVSASRAETVDHAAAEIRRIERDLHDGAQARLVSLGMHLGAAEELVERDPAAAAAILAEARQSTVAALAELRTLVREIHPPVLADRGLAGGVEALALDVALTVSTDVRLPGRPPAPVESAAYFAVAESLANIVKHARAGTAWITVSHLDGVLRVRVGDDGVGGADPDRGTGLAGIRRRLAALDGTLRVTSPAGGPTTVDIEVPCALS